MPDNPTLADAFLDHYAPDDWFRDPKADYGAVDSDRIPELRDALVDFIAHVVAAILNAGSERDAVNESMGLHNAIEDELKGWTA